MLTSPQNRSPTSRRLSADPQDCGAGVKTDERVVYLQARGTKIIREGPCRLTPCEEGHAEQDEVVEEFAA